MNTHDLIIIGGGPGGISALLWCHSLGLRGVLLEQASELGGQMLQMHHQVLDYPGLVTANGRELRDHFVAHLQQLQLDYRLNCQLAELDLSKRRLRCNNEWLQSRAIIIATGARKRKLGIPGEERFALHGVSYSATRDHSLYAGKYVAVIGGGDSAVEGSLMLARMCPRVMLIHRSDQFRARPEWLAAAQQTPNIEIITHAEAKEIRGADKVTGLVIADTHTGATREVPLEGVFIRVGIAPNTEFLQGQLELDEAGYIKVDLRQQTSMERVYAVGDVCRPVCWSVATAVGQGAVAAKDAAERIKAAMS